MPGTNVIVLAGGPGDLPQLWPAPPGQAAKVKIPWRNGYEHFEATDEYAPVGGRCARVYRWSQRTFIAE